MIITDPRRVKTVPGLVPFGVRSLGHFAGFVSMRCVLFAVRGDSQPEFCARYGHGWNIRVTTSRTREHYLQTRWTLFRQPACHQNVVPAGGWNLLHGYGMGVSAVCQQPPGRRPLMPAEHLEHEQRCRDDLPRWTGASCATMPGHPVSARAKTTLR